MLLTLEGKIVRRLLVNFWADPAVIRRLVPDPLEVATQDGLAVVGICLLRLAELRPKGMPAWMGIAAENMAHRVAVRVPGENGPLDGVFIFRRDTNCGLLAQVGGRLFPAVHKLAEFDVTDSAGHLDFRIHTDSAEADLTLAILPAPELDSAAFRPSNLFESIAAASDFFRRAECGYSCTLREGTLEGVRLTTPDWQLTSVQVTEVHSAFYRDANLFPPGSIGFDSAFLLRDVRSEWHALRSAPELACFSA
jgi:hypothetical protein